MIDEVPEQELSSASDKIETILSAVGRRVVGQHQLRKRLLMALVTDGHILLEGVPGLAKTRSIKAIADAIDASFSRIQFTPDLLPADLIGTEIFRPKDGNFEVRQGPVFANIVLADEINRAPAKVQSALLETMQEKQVTIGSNTFELPKPFFVLATQNPLEQEGTYPLPEAQVDRFMMKVLVDYPSIEEEKEIIDLIIKEEQGESHNSSTKIATLADIESIKKTCKKIYADERIKNYIVDIVSATRNPERFRIKDLDNLIEVGASPRATISCFLAAQAQALFSKDMYITPQHVKDIAHDTLRHRVAITYEAEAQGLTSDDIISTILESVPVP